MRMPFLRQKPKLSSNMMVGLTEDGKMLADKAAARGPDYAILASLEERQPKTISELADDTGMHSSECKARVERLARSRLVRVTNMEG